MEIYIKDSKVWLQINVHIITMTSYKIPLELDFVAL